MNIRRSLLLATVFAIISCSDKQPTATGTSSSSSDQTQSSVAIQTSSSQGLASSSSVVQSSSLQLSSSTPSTRTDTTKGISRDSLLKLLRISNLPASNEDKWLAFWDSLLTATTNPDSLFSLTRYPVPADSEMGKNWCGFDSATYDLRHTTTQPYYVSMFTAWDTVSSAGKVVFTSDTSFDGAISPQGYFPHGSDYQCQYKGVKIEHKYFVSCSPNSYRITFPNQTKALCVYPDHPELYSTTSGLCYQGCFL